MWVEFFFRRRGAISRPVYYDGAAAPTVYSYTGLLLRCLLSRNILRQFPYKKASWKLIEDTFPYRLLGSSNLLHILQADMRDFIQLSFPILLASVGLVPFSR